MTTFLLVAGYLSIVASLVYLEARLTGDACVGLMWLVWPFTLPILLTAWAFTALGDLGQRHHRG